MSFGFTTKNYKEQIAFLLEMKTMAISYPLMPNDEKKSVLHWIDSLLATATAQLASQKSK